MACGVAVALAMTACSGGDDESSDATNPVESSSAPADTGPLFDPSNPDNTQAPVPGTEVQLDDDVIIATDDGEIPSSTTEPAPDPNGPDAPPVVSAAPSVAPVPLPDPADVGRIVSVSPTHTETLFAMGLGEFVVGVDNLSDFPEAALSVRRDDVSADSSDLAPLLALDPDVVIIGDDPTDLAGRLAANGIASFVGPTPESLDGVFVQIRGIAALVGRPELGDDLVGSMQASIDATIASLPDTSERSYFHEVDPSLVTIAAGTFLDSIYGELGLVSIAPADESGFVQLSSEAVVGADPDVLILADVECCGVSAEVLAQRPGWSAVAAVSNGAVVEVQDYMVSRWGPRVVELVDVVAAGVASAG